MDQAQTPNYPPLLMQTGKLNFYQTLRLITLLICCEVTLSTIQSKLYIDSNIKDAI